MTIGEAISKYSNEGKDAVSPLLREIINSMIDNNTQTEFANDSYFDALYLTDVMFNRAKSSIRLLTGPGVDSFLSALKTPLLGVLERFKKSGGSVQIVILSKDLPAWLAELAKKYSTVLQIRRATSTEPIKHFIVCDSRMARVEDFHPPLSNASLASEIKARVYFNEPSKAKVFEHHFGGIWEAVGKFPINREPAVA